MSGLCSLTVETIRAAAGKFRVTDVPPNGVGLEGIQLAFSFSGVYR
jgi:hypothetical protein